MESALDHLITDNPPTQTLASQDEQLDIEPDIKFAPSLIPGLFTSNEKKLRDQSNSTHQAVHGSVIDYEKHRAKDLTKNETEQSANLDITPNFSSLPSSEIPPSFQNEVVEKILHVNEDFDENSAAALTQSSLPLTKVQIAESQANQVLSPDIVGWSARNSQQLSEIIVPSAAPVTALAPTLEPTAAICEVSLETSRIEVNADAGIFQSDHIGESLLPTIDAGKPYSSGAFADPQNSPVGNFENGKDISLTELIQNSINSEADQFLATCHELTPSKNSSVLDGSLPVTKEAQESQAGASNHVGGPILEGQNDLEAEFEVDLSPIESSSSDTSTDSSSSDESDDDDDYKMLDPAEQAARLMQEDGGSDDEGTGKGNHGAGVGPPRTLNEKPDEVVPKPNLIITENMKITELGHVENLVENLVLIKAKISGEYQVLEFGSVLCLENRIVIGVVAETLGRVEQPFYAVHFTNAAAIVETGISRGTKIFYVEQHSTTVFTQPLKSFKGSDASNLHDEEVGDEAVEFSDDEAEAEYKRKLKLTKQAKRDIREGSKDNFSRGGRQRGGKTQKLGEENHSAQNGASRSDYNDAEGGEDLYTPLARPSNLHEIMGRSEAPLEDQNLRHRTDRGGRGGRSRGDRGRGRNDRGRGNRGYRDRRGGSNDNCRMANDYQNRARAPGNGVGQRAEVHPLPSTNNFLPPRPAPTDAAFPSYPTAGQTDMGPPTPSIHQSSPQQMAHHNPSNQNNSPYNPPYQQSSFYAPQPQPSYNSSQSQPAHYQPQFQSQSQPQPPQYIPPSPHYQQQPIPYPQYQPLHSPSTSNVPPGTFINPAFFLPSAQPAFQTWPQPNPTQQPQSSLAGGGNSGGMSSEAERVFHALNVLKNLSPGDGSHPT